VDLPGKERGEFVPSDKGKQDRAGLDKQMMLQKGIIKYILKCGENPERNKLEF